MSNPANHDQSFCFSCRFSLYPISIHGWMVGHTLTSYTCSHPSPLPDASSRPGGLKDKAYTGRLWSENICRQVPVTESHNRVVESNDALQTKINVRSFFSTPYDTLRTLLLIRCSRREDQSTSRSHSQHVYGLSKLQRHPKPPGRVSHLVSGWMHL
jgi:hypothetical protein